MLRRGGNDEQRCVQGGYAYIRLSNPTCEAAEKAVNSIEGGFGSIVFGSGMAAISTALLTFLHPGDHIVRKYKSYTVHSIASGNACRYGKVGID